MLSAHFTTAGTGYCTGATSEASNWCSSDLLVHPAQSGYLINPLEKLGWMVGENLGRHGTDWPIVEASKNVGLYGHVVPIHMASATWSSCRTRWNLVSNPGNPAFGAPLYYKVEYWQFFRFQRFGIMGHWQARRGLGLGPASFRTGWDVLADQSGSRY